MMNWLPTATDFALALKAACEVGDPLERCEKLARLAQFRLGFVETIQLDNAWSRATKEMDPGFPRVRLAVLASSTINHLIPGIRVAGLRRRFKVDIYAAAYGQYRRELLDPASALHDFEPEMVLFSLTFADVMPRISLEASANEVERFISAAVADLHGLWEQARERLGATLIQQSFLNVTDPLFGSFDRLVPGAPTRVVTLLNEAQAAAAGESGVLLLDVARSSARDGLDTWFDVTRWLQGKIEIAPAVSPLYGDLVGRLIAAQRGQSKKCLVLDLDNTLWGGVVGDDGLEGIVLGEGSAQGEAHLALQRYAKLLKERGIILAVCSKNESGIAETAFRDHPEMLLERSDIAIFVANWRDKTENLRSIAEQLNIGLESLVLVDDNPLERSRVRESLPMVAVPELPADPAHYVRCIADAGYFEAVSFTAEDRQRGGQYGANLKRQVLQDSAQSLNDFLRGLEMSVTFGPVRPFDLARVTQLINKTNQFNTTTRRCASEELAGLAEAQENIALQFRLVDRFGDNGLVSVMILCPHPEGPDVLEIVIWVMSCRVFGRQLEDEAMNIAVEAGVARGARKFHADYIPTERNGVISGLYEQLGFSRAGEPGGANGVIHWSLNLSEYVCRPTFLTRRSQAA